MNIKEWFINLNTEDKVFTVLWLVFGTPIAVFILTFLWKAVIWLLTPAAY